MEDSSSVLNFLEKGLYLSNSNTETVKSKLVEFSNYLNGSGRTCLINASKEDYEEFLYLLLTLKKSIKQSLAELGKSNTNKKKTKAYFCAECNQQIEIGNDIWDSLQNHEHFEQLFMKFLNGTLLFNTDSANESDLIEEMEVEIDRSSKEIDQIEIIDKIEAVAGPSHTQSDSNNENTDSGIEHCEATVNGDDMHNSSCSDEEDYFEGSNTFRFNFKMQYDAKIKTKIYPDSLMKSVRKLDKVSYYTIQKSGSSRCVCLICCCDLMSKGRVSKFSIIDHVLGQRHSRQACNTECLTTLQAYHEAFMSLELSYQAHQVYFRPQSEFYSKCIACSVSVKNSEIIKHIQMKSHRSIVLDSFKKKSNLFYLMEVQVLVYGDIIIQDIDVKQEDTAVKEKVPKERVPNQKKKKNDPDPKPERLDAKEALNNIVKSVKDPNSTNIKDVIPYRFRDHARYFKENGNIIHCEPCKMNLTRDVEMLKKHIRQTAHQKMTQTVLIKYNFFCEICNAQFTDENTWSKHFTEGPNRHGSMAESRKNKATEYECTNCLTVIFGDDLSLSRHVSAKHTKELRQDKKVIKLPEKVKKMFGTEETLKAEAQKLANEAKDTLKYDKLTKECCAKLETTLNSVFGRCQAFPFGSRISGLGNQYSDLDVFIDIGDMYLGGQNQDAMTQVQIVRKASGALSRFKEEFVDVFSVPTARTPIVKVFHKKTEIECDLSFRHGLSVENTKFVRFCLDLQPIAQPFILLLKNWSLFNNLNEHISTYALAMVAIFYLQINNYLLPVTKIKELNPTHSLVINGWETINYTMPVEHMKKYIIPYEHSITKLLRDFFEYCAKFPYPTDVICPLLGHTIKKDLFNGRGEKLPPQMRAYVKQLSSQEPEQFRSMSMFCIQDPFDLSHNLTKACQPGTVNKFKTLCSLSYQHLDALK